MKIAIHSGTKDTAEIRSLTGLRGVAAIVVVLYHYQLAVTNKGYLSVDLFFVLSGFVMTMSYADRFVSGSSFQNYAFFLKRRFARIYPIYFVVLLLTFLIDTAQTPDRFSTLVTNVLLIQQFGLDFLDFDLGRSVVGQAWSISAEFGAYLLFPALLLVAVARSRRIAVATACVCLMVLAAVALAPYSNPHQAGPLDNHWFIYGFARCVAEFTLGMIVHRAYRASIRPPGWLGVVLIVAIATLAFRRRVDFVIVFLFPFLVLCAAQRGSIVAIVFGWRPIHFLGQISYSLYMIHIMTRLAEPGLAGLIAGTGVSSPGTVTLYVLIAVDILIGYVCFLAIEAPARRWLRLVLEGRRPGPIAADPAAP